MNRNEHARRKLLDEWQIFAHSSQTPALWVDRNAQQHITHENTVCILCALVHLLCAQQSVILREKRKLVR